MVLGSPVKRLARRVVKGRLEKAGMAGLAAVAVAAAALLLLLCAASLRSSAAFGSAVSAAPRKLWTGGVSIAAEASAAAAAETRGNVAAGNEECDLFDGEWLWDDGYPLYESRDCPFLDVGFRCSENGRPDASYTKWRWQPSRCDLPRFDAKVMLEKLRNKRVVFVGDSIGRNQWESLLCMLSTAVSNKSSIYEVNGSPITKHMGFLIFNFRDYNCTVEYYRSPFIVLQGRAPAGAPEFIKYTIRVDAMDWMSDRGKWKDADVLIFNTGHWWNNEKTIRGGAYFQAGDEVKMEMSVADAYQISIQTLSDWLRKEVNTSKTHVIYRTYAPVHFRGAYFQAGDEVKMEMSVADAYQISIQTLSDWLRKEVNTSKTHVIYRTYAPVHFRGGDWKTGGSCHLETLPDVTPLKSLEEWSDLLKPVNDVLGNNLRPKLHGLDMLNVTQMTAQRKDGHLSVYLSRSGPVPRYKQDCSHWCLPGVPDTWNELLYALVVKRHTMMDQNVPLAGTETLNTGR